MTVTEQTSLRRAFAQIRKEGVVAVWNQDGCCRTCIWYDEQEAWDGKPVLWNFAGQGHRVRFDRTGKCTTHDVIYLYHNSETFPKELARAVEILGEHGLTVKWDGNPDKSIVIDLTVADDGRHA